MSQLLSRITLCTSSRTLCRTCSTRGPEKFIRFDDMVYRRRSEARKSLVVQIQSELSCNELHDYCSSLAPVSSMFHYSVHNNHYALVEFRDECVPHVMSTALHSRDSSIPVSSPVLWFRANSRMFAGNTCTNGNIRISEFISGITKAPNRSGMHNESAELLWSLGGNESAGHVLTLVQQA